MQRSFPYRYVLALLAISLTALTLGGCLGTDPESKVIDPVPVVPTPVDPLARADKYLQDGKFAKAMEAYEKAIALDSTLSKAYWGYAIATARFYELDAMSMAEDLQEISETGNFSVLLEHSDTVLTNRLQASIRITHMLGILADRDTLSRSFRYLDSGSSAEDPQFEARKAFINAYLTKADLGVPGYRARANFPLTDGKVTFDNFVRDYAVFLTLRTFLGMYDFEPKGIFNEQDRILMNLLSENGSNGDLGDISDLVDQMKTDTLLQESLNQKILELQNGLADLSQLLGLVGVPDSGSAEAVVDYDSAVVNLGKTISFYQFGDRKDNDGDGCIDEEIIDSLDNDLDGFVDEDARLINGNGVLGSSTTGPADGVDNDHNGRMDGADAGENKLGGFTTASGTLTFVVLSGQGDNWVKIKKGAFDMDARISIQQDSLALPSRASLPGYAAKIQSAKTLVGGCWRNY